MTAGAGATALRAAWVAPMDRPPIAGGAVLVEGGRVVAVDSFIKGGRFAAPAASVRDFGDAVILPGLVNAHTHLELSHLRPPRPAPRFVDWLKSVVGSAGDAGAAARSAAVGAAESLRHGVTTVGDITRFPGAVRAALRDTELHVVSFGEVVGMARRRHVLGERLAAALAEAGPRVLRAISPHAPYSIDADGYRQCLAAAGEHGLAVTTHLAETAEESAFLSDHAGPFRELWEHFGFWEDDPFPRFPGGPVRYAQSLGLLDCHQCALAHVNYCTDAELALLARGRASVVYCPRTHAYFGHPPHRWREMLARGVNVAVGTDSRASSPDLDLVEELRLLHRVAPEVPTQTLWELATTRATRALGLEASVGSIAPGRSADLAVLPASGTDPLALVLETQVGPPQVWVEGRPLVTGG